MTKDIGENYSEIYGKHEYPDWSSSSKYEQYDRVNYKGATYAARKANSDVNPFFDDGDTWQLIEGVAYEAGDTLEVEDVNGTLVSGRKVNASGGVGSNVTSAGLNIYGIKASKTGYGVVKAGEGINISDGVISTEHTKPYTLPIASSSTLGGVKVGNGLSIASDGTLSNNVQVKYATKSTSGYVQLGDGLKAENASGLTSVDYGVGLTMSNSKLSLKPATVDVIGGVKPDGDTITIDEDGTLVATPQSSGSWVDVPFKHNFPSTMKPLVKSNGCVWLIGFYMLKSNVELNGTYKISDLPTNYFMIKEDLNTNNIISQIFYSKGYINAEFSVFDNSISVSVSSSSSRVKELKFCILPYSPTEI